jgi:hypothetical protein
MKSRNWAWLLGLVLGLGAGPAVAQVAQMYWQCGTGWCSASVANPLPILVSSLPLPSGGATSTLQTTGNNSLASILAKQPALGAAGTPSVDVLSVQGVAGGTALPVSGIFWQATQPVSVVSLPLPTGAAPAPLQGTGGVTSATVGTSSAQALAAGARVAVLSIQNVSASASVACSLGGTAALNTAGSFQIAAGQILAFNTNYIPQDAVNCIASASSTPVTVIAK